MTAWQLEDARTLQDAAEGTLRPGGLSLTRQALDLCRFVPGSRILDAGCGTGATLRHLASRGRLSVFGIDSSASLLAEACRHPQRPPLLRGELESLPLASQSLDGIICECTLSQTKVSAVLAEFSRVLRPGGRLIISDLYRKLAQTNRAGGSGRKAPLATREQGIARLRAAQFETLHWQDRSRELKQLAVRLVMAPGACLDNLFGWSRPGSANPNPACADWQAVGYQLLIAERVSL